MFDMGWSELLLVAVLALVVVGPERLPGLLRSLGRWISQIKQYLRRLQTRIDMELHMDEVNQRILRSEAAHPPTQSPPAAAHDHPAAGTAGASTLPNTQEPDRAQHSR